MMMTTDLHQLQQLINPVLAETWEPPPMLKVSEWAEQNRILPKGTSARPGQWVTESFQREMMDALLTRGVREIVCMKSTQVGWSEILNNIIGYFIDADPKPMMMVQPTDRTAKDYSKKRIAPMIAACPALKAKVREPTSRRPGNTMLLKEFDGGFLKIAGANAGAGLRSDPIAVLLLDEVDGYPDDVEGEGDPVEIATRRTDTFHDAKILKGSTPGKPKGLSRIEADWERSDQRRYYVPCPFCNHFQVLCWRDSKTAVHRLVWEKDENGEPVPGTVRYICAGCGQGIDEKYKQRMLDAGYWQATYPDRKVIGFHINALYSPWRLNWHELAQEWTEAQENPEKLKAFVNLRLGETWDEGGESFGAHVLAARREQYAAPVPRGVAVLVAAADVQHNRIEAQIMGFGKGEESWLIAHEVFWGDPGLEVDPETGMDVWARLDEFLLRQWRHEVGALLMPAITLVDSGMHADSVYDFVLPRQHTRRRIFACKGVDYLSKPGLVQEGTTKRSKIRLWVVATHAAKDRVFARMKIPAPGPGYMHLPDWVTEEYLEQLTGEKKITVRDKRTRTKKHLYVKTYARNEALDLTVYCHAGLFILQHFIAPALYRDLGTLADSVNRGQSPEALTKMRRVRSTGIL
jgi:phage terminase large subunit GpA-like protein